jgi:hypothetical protein
MGIFDGVNRSSTSKPKTRLEIEGSRDVETIAKLCRACGTRWRRKEKTTDLTNDE